MPLLNKKPLQLQRYNKKLEDDAEVFYCKCTNEVFEDYEEYCQRVISCNSLIWTCAITGKSNLTYQEALASEENALKLIKNFPLELRTPVLYLAMKANRRNLNDLVSDVFNFAKDRYFLGEFVEVDYDGVWVYGHVLQVILPDREEVNEYQKLNNIPGPVNSRPYPSCLYKYEVEQLDDDSDLSEVRILPADKIRRIKGMYTKEKNRTYLKQFLEFKKNKWRIQSNILAKYSISSISFSRMFAGEPPLFEDPPLSEAKFTQPTIEMFLGKTSDKSKVKKLDGTKKSTDLEGIRKKYEETIDKVVQQSRKETVKQQALEAKAKKLEELKKKREQEKEEKARWAKFVKDWHRKRDDLECEDLKALPEPSPVNCSISNEHFGDVVMILEFLESFRDVLKVKDFFPVGLKFYLIERAFVKAEIAGPFSDILQLLLSSLFTLQEQEDDEIKSTDVHRSSDWEIYECRDMSTAEAIKLATVAASWSRTHYGVPLNRLFLDAITVSEVLRLHLLASGRRPGDRSAKWRYQERGGYTSMDDPCLMLRLKDSHILRFLAVKSAVELPIADKIKVVSCLINQILTYAGFRDIIEERYEKVRTGKNELKNDQIAESKKERELTAQKLKERKEAKEKGEIVPEETDEQKEKEVRESNRKKAEFQKRAIQLQKAAMDCQIVPLGQDRSYRKFWIFKSMAGLFIEDNEEFPGSCLPKPTPIANDLTDVEEDTMSYIKKLFEEERNCGSDKENEGNSSYLVTSPKKKLLSESNDLTNTLKSILSPTKKEEQQKIPDWVCTADTETCPVHSCRKNRMRWTVYHEKSQIEKLINCLNKRGYREHRLRKALIESKDSIVSAIEKCPLSVMHQFASEASLSSGMGKATRSQKLYENANLKYPEGTSVQEILELYIRELILDTEGKIHCGGLGTLKVQNRRAWREAIERRTYDQQDEYLTWRQHPIKKEKKEEKKEEETSRPNTPCSVDSNPELDALTVKMDQNHVLKDLTSAVLQIARSVEARYLKKSLWEGKYTEEIAMAKWESSLMSSTSFSQLYLHISILENTIKWDKSALNAKCKVCRKGGDAECMLLCDRCNRGFHLYCLKPKLMAIPKGDWFCLDCQPRNTVEKPKRLRRLFSEKSDDEEDQPLVSVKPKWRRSEEVTRKRKSGKVDEEEDSGDEPLSKIARTSRRSAQKKDVD